MNRYSPKSKRYMLSIFAQKQNISAAWIMMLVTSMALLILSAANTSKQENIMPMTMFRSLEHTVTI